MSHQARVNDVPNKHSRISGFAQGDRSWLGEDDIPTVAMEFWSSIDESVPKYNHYSVVGVDPAYARRIAHQLLEMADYAEGL